jgi:integrase
MVLLTNIFCLNVTKMALNNTQINAIQPRDKAYKVMDEHSLYLFVNTVKKSDPNQTNKKKFVVNKDFTMTWRWNYSIKVKGSKKRKQGTFVIGKFSHRFTEGWTQAAAHEERRRAAKLVALGIDPNEDRKKKQQAEELEITFKQLWDMWFPDYKDKVKAPQQRKVKNAIENYALDHFKDMFLDDIESDYIARKIKDMERDGRSLVMLRTMRQQCRHMYIWAKTLGYAKHNPFAELSADGNVLKNPKPSKRRAHYKEPKDIAMVLKSINEYHGTLEVRTALKLAPHLMLRPINLVGLRWDEIDWQKKQIFIDKKWTKNNDLIVPLSTQVLTILQGIKAINGDEHPRVFRSLRAKYGCIGTRALTDAMKTMGYMGKQSIHGFRHTASTRLNHMRTSHNWTEDDIELQQDRRLAKTDKTQRGVYFETKAETLIETRTTMMQSWSDYLYSLS